MATSKIPKKTEVKQKTVSIGTSWTNLGLDISEAVVVNIRSSSEINTFRVSNLHGNWMSYADSQDNATVYYIPL